MNKTAQRMSSLFQAQMFAAMKPVIDRYAEEHFSDSEYWDNADNLDRLQSGSTLAEQGEDRLDDFLHYWFRQPESLQFTRKAVWAASIKPTAFNAETGEEITIHEALALGDSGYIWPCCGVSKSDHCQC